MGGYIRYLYKTAKIKLGWSTSKIILFRWNEVPGKDSSKLREYLKNKLGLSWISFEEFTKEGSQISIKTESNRVVIGKEGNLVVIESNGKIVQKLVMTNKGFVKDNVAPYNEMASLFYSSVEDLALLFLAPLLAIAIWFFLVQGGMEDGKYTLALAAFATGLVTDEIINSLTEFIRRVTGRVKENMNDSGGSSTNRFWWFINNNRFWWFINNNRFWWFINNNRFWWFITTFGYEE